MDKDLATTSGPPRRKPFDLEAARREVALREAQMPRPPKTESRLVLARPENDPPKGEVRVKYVTERPYLERNKRYSPFSLR